MEINAVSSETHTKQKMHLWKECIVFWHVRKMAESDFYLRRVCPSAHMQQLGSHWTDFHEILYLSIFRKPVGNTQVPLKSNKNKGYFT